MKTNNALLAFFFFFFFVFASVAGAEFVYDTTDVIVNNGVNYFLVSPGFVADVIAGAPIKKGNNSCSLAVIQKIFRNDGWLTKIQTPNLTLYITTNNPLTLSFATTRTPIPCTKNPKWLVTRISGFGDAVMVGDVKEYPNHVSGWFYIKAYDSAKKQYKLVFCYKKGKCGHVGAKTDSGNNRRLIVTENKQVQPLIFQFIRQTSDVVDSSDISMVV